ncbi:GNAT family N-acetyltransferase [Streptomyces sp. 150FB]|uniref:GNAT family N-acetyltransferase n=1 Tax=Streptomyces sp. 150FB TaxID=1576605 RepID=UPI00069662FB|nr:GNAT family N-acetyltransferase [Streptomyces sp. 150FB]
MYPAMDLAVGDLRLRTLTGQDVDLVVEATHGEPSRALWGSHLGPYSPQDARDALAEWEQGSADQVSFGVLADSRLVAAFGLIESGPGAAEVAYWVRPEARRQGIGLRGLRAVTQWAHRHAGLRRVWLEIKPENAASQRLAEAAGYRFEERMPLHCRTWVADDPEQDVWHDCMIWGHGFDEQPTGRAAG